MGAWQITKKDLRLLIRDRRALAVLIAFPLAFIGILGLSAGEMLGWRRENQQLRIAAVNQDRGDVSQQLLARLQALDGVALSEAVSLEEAREQLDDHEASVILVLGRDFQRKIDRLSTGDVLALRDGRLCCGLDAFDMRLEYRPSTATVAAIARHVIYCEAVQTVTPGIFKPSGAAAKLLEQSPARARPGPRASEELEATNVRPEQDGFRSDVYQTLVPGYTVMFTFFLVNIMGRSFISERELGTLRRLRMAPITPTELLIGKTAPFFVISVFQNAVLFGIGRVVFGMSWGLTPWLLIPIIIATALAATALGLLVAALVRTDSQVSAYGNFLVITMAGVSGCFMPRDWLPEILERISLATPHAWALIAFDEVFDDHRPALGIVFRSCGMLVGFAAAFFAFGVRKFQSGE